MELTDIWLGGFIVSLSVLCHLWARGEIRPGPLLGPVGILVASAAWPIWVPMDWIMLALGKTK